MDKRTFLKQSLLAGLLVGSRTAGFPGATVRPFALRPGHERPGREWPEPAIGTIMYARFSGSALPPNWVERGGFVPTAEGLQSPGRGGWDVYTYWNKLVVLDEDRVACTVTVQDTASVFAVARLSEQKRGTVAEVDFSAGKLILYTELPVPGAVPEGIVAQTPIGFAAVPGRDYHLVLQKVSETYHFTLVDSVSQQSVQLTHVATGKAPTCGKCWNWPGFLFRSGSVRLQACHYSSDLPKQPKVLVVGDSIADGDTLRLEPGGGYRSRWAGRLATALNEQVTIVARGGESSAQVNDKLPLLLTLLGSPPYVIYAIGTNDSGFSTWQANYLRFKAAFEARGAEVIPTTLFPRNGREPFTAEVTRYIRQSSGRSIDFARALTVGGAYTTRESSFFLSDNLHPNTAGHQRMFERIRIDLPDLFG